MTQERAPNATKALLYDLAQSLLCIEALEDEQACKLIKVNGRRWQGKSRHEIADALLADVRKRRFPVLPVSYSLRAGSGEMNSPPMPLSVGEGVSFILRTNEQTPELLEEREGEATDRLASSLLMVALIFPTERFLPIKLLWRAYEVFSKPRVLLIMALIYTRLGESHSDLVPSWLERGKSAALGGATEERIDLLLSAYKGLFELDEAAR